MIQLQQILASVQAGSLLSQEACLHFSQSGEDIIIDALLYGEQEKGLFVDIGAYNPIRFSNTFLLYLQGWRGINVDGNSQSMETFRQVRPDDTNIHALVSDRVETIEFYRFPEGAWNTTDAAGAKLLQERDPVNTPIIAVETHQTVPLSQILDEYVGKKKFDFLNIDVEGMDLKLLYSIDFKKYRPKLIAFETSMEAWNSEPLASFIEAKGYEVHSHCIHTAILKRKD